MVCRHDPIFLVIAEKELGVKPTAVKFFREAKWDEHEDFKATDRLAQCEQNLGCVWIRDDLRAGALIRACAHEMRHLLQPVAMYKSEEWYRHEEEADAFAAEFASKFSFIPSWAWLRVHYGDKKPEAFETDNGAYALNTNDDWLYMCSNDTWTKIRKWR